MSRLTIQELEGDLGIPNTAVSEILMQDLGMKYPVAISVLQPEQKEHRAAVANDLIQTATNEPDFLKKVITGDELWVYGYGPEKKGPVVPVEVAWFSTPEEGVAKSQQYQDHVNCVV